MASEEERAKIMAEYLASSNADDGEEEADFDPTDHVSVWLHCDKICSILGVYVLTNGIPFPHGLL